MTSVRRCCMSSELINYLDERQKGALSDIWVQPEQRSSGCAKKKKKAKTRSQLTGEILSFSRSHFDGCSLSPTPPPVNCGYMRRDPVDLAHRNTISSFVMMTTNATTFDLTSTDVFCWTVHVAICATPGQRAPRIAGAKRLLALTRLTAIIPTVDMAV